MAGLRIRCTIWNFIILMPQCTETLSSTFHLRKGSATPRPERRGRTTTKDEKNYLGAVGVISDRDDKTLFVYHNYHAEIEFPAEVFSDAYCHHYWKGHDPHGEPWKWHTEKPG